jgi:D-3-phosphoglycerate dehydrogenase
VNFPEVNLPEHAGSRRLLHIHHNVPGVLSRINDVFSQGGVNINAQYLQTAGDLGYVVIDVSAPEAQSESLREQLAAIPGTVRTRLLY